MDRRVILAVAGSGKTTRIINTLDENSRAAIVTYTENNYENLRKAIMHKFGYIPRTIKLYTYFRFLYSFCFRPFLLDELNVTGITFTRPPNSSRGYQLNDIRRYINDHRQVYHNRLAKLLEVRDVIAGVNNRLSQYFDHLFIDEVQDFAGHDFNFLLQISQAHLNHVYVGDFYQHTFDTSKDGNVNAGLHNNLDQFLRRLRSAGFRVDRTTLSRSYRCSPTICQFVTENLEIAMESNRSDQTLISWIETQEDAWRVFSCNATVKLFLQKHYEYGCVSNNWGASKGDEYTDVCVVLNNESYEKLANRRASELNPQTRNKLYVACTRATNSLYFVRERLMRNCLNA